MLSDEERRVLCSCSSIPCREKDEATSPVLCGQMAESKRAIPVQATLWKGAYHAFEDHYSVHIFHGYHIGYNAAASEGTIKAIIADLTAALKAMR